MQRIAKLFKNGNSQAVRLPMEFRLEGSEVGIRREGEVLILEPLKKKSWPKGFFKRVQISDSEFKRPLQGETPPSPKFR